MATIRKRSVGTYQVRWREKRRGQWLWRGRTCRTYKAARKLQREVEEAVALQGYWEPEERREADGDCQVPGLRQLIAAFLVAMKAGGKADNTILRYGQALEVFERWTKEEYPGEHVTGAYLSESMVHSFYVWLGKGTGRHGKPRAASSKRKYVEVVLNLWSWLCSKDDWRDYVPTAVPNVAHMDIEAAPRKLTRAPTWEEMDAVIACATGWKKRLYIVLRFTGLRVQQAMELRWDDLELESGVLRVRPELGKTPQERTGRWVPVSQHLVDIVSGWGRREGYLIETAREPGGNSRPCRQVRSRAARRAWDRAIKQYGVRKDVASQPHHAFRAGFVTGLKRLGADDEAVEVLVGHSIGLRGLYTDPEAQPMKQAVALIPPLSQPVAREVPIELGSRNARGAVR